eukprot:scaffold7444_cov67-Skeletonema_marinoi.AAC.2
MVYLLLSCIISYAVLLAGVGSGNVINLEEAAVPPARNNGDDSDGNEDDEIIDEDALQQYDPHWSFYKDDDDDAEGEEEKEFGHNKLQIEDVRHYSKRRKILWENQILAGGNFSVTNGHTCQGKQCGLRCHPKKAMAYVERDIDIDGCSEPKRLCWLCEYEYFHLVEHKRYTNVEPTNIIKRPTDVYFPLGEDRSPVSVHVCGGDVSILYDLWNDGDFSMTYHEVGGSAEDLQAQTQRMIDNHLFADYYTRRHVFASGVASSVTTGIMQGETAYREMLEFMGMDARNIVHNWCQLGGDGSYQDYHSDKFHRSDAQSRHVWNVGVGPDGKVRKMMTIANRKEGKWCSFLVPHLALVSMSLIGSGAASNAKHWQHRVDFCEGVLCFISETLN